MNDISAGLNETGRTDGFSTNRTTFGTPPAAGPRIYWQDGMMAKIPWRRRGRGLIGIIL